MPKFSKFSFIIFACFLVILFSFSISFFNNVVFKPKIIYAQGNNNTQENNQNLQVGRYQLSIATGGTQGFGWVYIGIIDTLTGKIWTRGITGLDKKASEMLNNGDNYYLWDAIKFKK